MTTTSHDALKPCPFCGCTPTVEPWHGGGPDKQIVHCEHYSCLVAPMVTGETPKLARLKWNTRFPASALAEENARLREALEVIPLEYSSQHSPENYCANRDCHGRARYGEEIKHSAKCWVPLVRAALAQKEDGA